MAEIPLEVIEQYGRDGFTIVPGLFSLDETERLRDHFMELRAKGEYPGDFGGVDPSSSDPLKRFPRMIHMHRWDKISMDWIIDSRLNEVMTALEGTEPYAVQTMLYFKPAGARGQALHQDQFYLRAKPGTCIAAWMALDDCDEENGCMRLVPGSHRWPLLCTEMADTTQSFTDVTVPIPTGTPVTAAVMKAGDVLFFHGQTIHGSYPNESSTRFRRALIGHYLTGDVEQVAAYYHPILRMDGTEVELGVSDHGGPCGVWTEAREIRMVEPEEGAAALHE